MAAKRVLVCCGTGIATSTAAASRLKRLLKERGVTVTTQECKAAEVPSKVASYKPHAILSTTQVSAKVQVKVFNGLPMVTGVGTAKLADEIAAYLKSVK